MRFRELFLQFVLDFQRCAEREGSGANAVQTRMGAQQFSGGALKMGQRLFDPPSFGDRAIATLILSLRGVHGVPFSLLLPFSDKRLGAANWGLALLASPSLLSEDGRSKE